MNFEETVKAMTGKEIVLAMINGLKESPYQINMMTFGDAENTETGVVCFGCAATSCITKISGVTFTARNITNSEDRAQALSCQHSFIVSFEAAINELRSGWVGNYNKLASIYGFEELPVPEDDEDELPALTTSDWRDNIIAYEQWAETL
jgi:hypothetical protein